MSIGHIALVAVMLIACLACLVVLPLCVIVAGVIGKRRNAEESRRAVQASITRITADGKVDGPAGPYVPHRRRGPLTPGTTSPPKHAGRYHHPWP